jgi:flagellar biosynthesis/type III secretory pathway M-ring protein FliF/YscJ
LAKLDSILTDIGELDQGLQDAQASIDDIPTEKKEEEGFGIAEGLLLVVIVLLIINLLVTLMGRKRRERGVEVIPEEEVEPESMALEEEPEVEEEEIEEFEEEPEEIELEEKEPEEEE